MTGGDYVSKSCLSNEYLVWALLLCSFQVYIGVELFDSQAWGKFTWSVGDSGDRVRPKEFFFNNPVLRSSLRV